MLLGLTGAVEICLDGIRDSLLIPSSTKSAVVGSSAALSQRVARSLKLRGMSIKAELCAKDLGVDAAGGRRRVTKVLQWRFAKAKEKVRRVRVLKKHLKGLASHSVK